VEPMSGIEPPTYGLRNRGASIRQQRSVPHIQIFSRILLVYKVLQLEL
jgi:hypothetical protein